MFAEPKLKEEIKFLNFNITVGNVTLFYPSVYLYSITGSIIIFDMN